MPEEINRVVTDHVSQWLFAPTNEAVSNLSREGFPANRIRQVGDVMYDATITYADDSRAKELLHRFGVKSGEYVLATIHRAENTDCDVRLRQIFDSLIEVANNIPVVFPAHPRTSAALRRIDVKPDHLKSVDPLGYRDMLALEKHARVIVTDSGGVQKEAFFFRVPCVVVRNETEWVELVRLGGTVLSSPEKLAENVSNISFAVPEELAAELYGEGKASHRIACDLVENLRWRF